MFKGLTSSFIKYSQIWHPSEKLLNFKGAEHRLKTNHGNRRQMTDEQTFVWILQTLSQNAQGKAETSTFLRMLQPTTAHSSVLVEQVNVASVSISINLSLLPSADMTENTERYDKICTCYYYWVQRPSMLGVPTYHLLSRWRPCAIKYMTFTNRFISLYHFYITPSKYRPNPIIRASLLRLHLISIIRSYSITLGAFAKLRKATISFVMSVCPSVRPHGKTRLYYTDVHEISYLSVFRKSSKSLKTDKNNGCFTWRPIYVWSYLPESFVEWEMFQTKVVDNNKTYLTFFFFETRAVF